MSGEKLTDRELIRLALSDAIGWQNGLMDAYSHMRDDPVYAEAKKVRDAYRALLKRRYNSTRTAAEQSFDRATKGAKLIGLDEFVAMARSKPGEAT